MSRSFLLFLLAGCGIPNGQDHEIATAIGTFISAGYGKFEDRADVDETHRGKTYYTGPGAGGNPRIDLYEITTPEDIARIEDLAKEALRRTEGANSVTLRFYEKQNWRAAPNGSMWRDSEKLLKQVRYKRGE